MAANYWKNVLRMISSSSSFRKYAAAGLCGYAALYAKSFYDRHPRPLLLFTPVYAGSSSAVQNFAVQKDQEVQGSYSPNGAPEERYSLGSMNNQQWKKIQSAVGARGRRFVDFASIVVNNELYMTPHDFLESVIQEQPKPRFGHQQLTLKQAWDLVEDTPPRAESSIELFRNLNYSGLISYTEYLFLLCVITKPRAGFEIAFKMFDTDENQTVDRDEFLVLGEIFEKRTAGGEMEGILANSSVKKTKDAVPTTLTVHLFGADGDEVFNYTDFFAFMDNLQTEILELEFLVYSKGMNFISEEDFARILLRFTDEKDTEESIERLRKNISVYGQGISFPEFRNFFQFVNNLEDFAIALRLYTLAGRSIGKADFKRAVKVSTDLDLSDNVVDTIFLIFDSDGDEKLSHVEFLGVMKDRVQRGFRTQKLPGTVEFEGFSGFKTCMTKEVHVFLRNLAARAQANMNVK